ncbi:hypothetical protein BHM03_00060978 [Ensete ventricosum]|nr:hypothetical protein BHM03_00060978 [Ensete ventricosum]
MRGLWRPVGNNGAPVRMARGNRYSFLFFFFFPLLLLPFWRNRPVAGGLRTGNLMDWVWCEAGACLIGGCCRTTPNTIRGISKVLQNYVPSESIP